MIEKIRRLVIPCMATVCILAHAGLAGAELFCVTTSEQIQTALTTAQSNGEDDQIHIVQGVYEGNFTFAPEEAYELTVKGGYSGQDCGARTADPANTTLDGDSAGTVLAVNPDWLKADFECDGVTFKNGSAMQGGGLLFTGDGDVALTNSIFTGNSAGRFGGGIYISSGGEVALSNNIINDNTSEYYAAGANLSGSVLTMNSNIINDNASQGAAGGAWLTEFDAISITNNVVHHNSASWYRGGLLITDSKSIGVINNTITRNQSEGSGAGLTIYLENDADSAVLYNNIILGNHGAPEANDLDIRNDNDGNGIASPVTLLYNNLDQSAAGLNITEVFAIHPSNLNNQDPSFADPAAGDYHLTAGSPCLDAGSSAGAPTADIEGVSRPRRWGHDMGAYEYVGLPVADIKANGSDEAVGASAGEAVSITLSLDAGALLGLDADWWIAESTPDGSPRFLDPIPVALAPAVTPALQSPLFSFPPTAVLNFTDLAPGVHTFYFAIDLSMDGAVTIESLFGDIVTVTIE